MIRIVFSVFTILLLSAGYAAAQDGPGERRAEVSIIAERSGVAPGETILAALKLEMEPGWHVYWRNPGDAGLPPELIIDESSPIGVDNVGEFLWPLPKLLPVTPGQIMDYGYDGEVVLPFRLTVPDSANGTIRLDAVADYLICSDICVPESAQVSLSLDANGPAENLAAGAEIANWVAKVPTPFEGPATIDTKSVPWTLSLGLPGGFPESAALRFFPYHHEISHPAEQPQRIGPGGASLSLTPDKAGQIDGTLDGIIRVDAPGAAPVGYIISAVPGDVLTGTSDMAVELSSPASDGTAGTPVGAAPGGLLVLLGLGLLGGLVLNLMPCVLPVLSIKALGLVAAAASGQAREIRAHGIWYTIGVLLSFASLAAALIAVRAATGFATLGFQLQHAPTVAVLALIMFAVGLWLMGFFEFGGSLQNLGASLANRQGAVGAFFTGVLAAVVGAPCVGPFLGAALGAVMSQPALSVFAVLLAMGFGMALPFLLLSFIPGLHRLLPRPGRWMETLRQAFAFPMFLTAAWLLAVLAGLSGPAAAGWTLAGATALAFAIWLGRQGGVVRRTLAAGAFAAAFLFPALQAGNLASAAGPQQTARTYATDAWSPERVAQLVAEGRPIFVDFTASWCASCQVNKLTTLQSARVRRAFDEANVAILVADFTRKDPVIAEELRRHGRAGLPLYLWYPPGQAEPQVLPELLSQELVIGLVDAI